MMSGGGPCVIGLCRRVRPVGRRNGRLLRARKSFVIGQLIRRQSLIAISATYLYFYYCW